jgi:phage FluMu protein Com
MRKAKTSNAAFDLTIRDEPESPRGWIQWKGTDVCMDIHCSCGKMSHVDAEFAYNIKCPHCGKIFMCNPNIELIEVECPDKNNDSIINAVGDLDDDYQESCEYDPVLDGDDFDDGK